MVGLLLIVGIGLVFAAAFWWFLPREENPLALQRRGGYTGGAGLLDVDRSLRRARSAAEEMEEERREWDRDLPSEADIERFGEARGDGDEDGDRSQ